MNLAGKTLLLTGATGGIGCSRANKLANKEAKLILVGRQSQRLQVLANTLPGGTDRHRVVCQDLLHSDAVRNLISFCEQLPDGIDGVINNAGISDFRLLRDWSQVEAEKILRLNLLLPMELISSLLPTLIPRKEALIVNVGSALGAIGNPGFSAYCASKAGLARFSESLRREVAETGVQVLHCNPRATDTELNSDATVAMNKVLGNRSDAPELVAARIMTLIEKNRFGEHSIGFPERLFIKLNALLPGIVDSAYKNQLPVIEKFAAQELDQADVQCLTQIK